MPLSEGLTLGSTMLLITLMILNRDQCAAPPNSFPGFYPTRATERERAGRREPWERGCRPSVLEKLNQRDRR